MPSPFHGARPPYPLPSNIVYFHDWRYVHTGRHRWFLEDGSSLGLFTNEPLTPMEYRPGDVPKGVRLVAQPARKCEPVIESGPEADVILFGGNLLHEGGLYRLWYDTWPADQFDTKRMGNFNYLRYAESDDGVEWRKPCLGLIEHNGSRENNIVRGGPDLATGYHGGCVFRDPEAPAAERYKSFHLGLASDEAAERYRRERPGETDPMNPPDLHSALMGAVSPDGLHWEALPDPLVLQTSDTHNVCEYDPALGKYVAYCRSWFFMRRTVGRMESDDFRRFPLPEELLWPNALMDPADLWYGNSKTRMPDAPGYHLMFPWRWRMSTDAFDIHLATSPDNVVWGMVPGGPLLEPGPPGAWDAGVVVPGVGMVELPGDRMGILYEGSPYPHKHPRPPGLGRLAWATWPKGRLVALVAEQEGSFDMQPLRVEGRRARINFHAGPTGFVRVEVVQPDKTAQPGRGFAECDTLTGDHLDHPITWGGDSDLGHPEDGPVELRFELRHAEIFGLRFD